MLRIFVKYYNIIVLLYYYGWCVIVTALVIGDDKNIVNVFPEFLYLTHVSINVKECGVLEKNMISEINKNEKTLFQIIKVRISRYPKKYFFVLPVLLMLPLLLFSFFIDSFLYVNSTDVPLKTQYLIQNLRGDITETWVSWNIPASKVLTFTIIGESFVSPEQIDKIKDVVLSKQSLEIDNSFLNKGSSGTFSTYYVGWQGAMEQVAKNPTQLVVPQRFEYVLPDNGVADITIILTSQRSSDGYSGYTNSVVDGNQILKSTITIYNVRELNTNQLATVTRHEFGHAIGLAHSTANEELMSETITTAYPFISPCTLDAIENLYDGNQKNKVLCEI